MPLFVQIYLGNPSEDRLQRLPITDGVSTRLATRLVPFHLSALRGHKQRKEECTAAVQLAFRTNHFLEKKRLDELCTKLCTRQAPFVTKHALTRFPSKQKAC